jgi:hypothetical protein
MTTTNKLRFAVLIIAAATLHSACCRKDFLGQWVSPDGRWKVVAEQSDCGATTSWEVGVDLIPIPWSPIAQKTLLFAMVLDHNGVTAWGQGHPDIDVVWYDNEHLLIRHTRGRNAHQESSARGINIKYEALE